MSKVMLSESYLDDIADAIRSKKGTQDTYTPAEMAEAIESISGGGITPTGTISITENGTVDVTQYASAEVNVPQGITPTGTISITQNGTTDVTNYASANVNVANSYSAGDEGKVVSNGALVAQTSDTVTANDTYDTTLINSLIVAVSGALTEKSGSFTVSSDYSYILSVKNTYTGSLLINTGLNDIAMVCVWDEAWADQTGERPRFGSFFWVSSAYLGSIVPRMTGDDTTPYYYGLGSAANATTSNWYGGSSTTGPITNEMTSSVAKGSFGIKTHSPTYSIKAGSTIRWKAWGY